MKKFIEIKTGNSDRDARFAYLLSSLDWLIANGDKCSNCGALFADQPKGWDVRFHQDAKCAEKN